MSTPPSLTSSSVSSSPSPSNRNLEEIVEFALEEGKRLGCSDVSVIGANSRESQVRFSNNAITLVNNVRNVTLEIYIAKDRKRIVGATYNPSEAGIRKFMQSLLSSCLALPQSEDYVPLPQGPFHYRGSSNHDPKVSHAPLVELVGHAIDQALKGGASRASGSLNAETTDLFIRTSGGASAHDSETMMLLNVRAFAADNASGHGLCCTSYLSDFDPGRAGLGAGEYARKALNPSQVPEGKYDIVFAPTVVANILPIASQASAFAIESGVSFLIDRLEQRVGVQTLFVEDYGVYDHGLGGRIFDDEGLPTRYTEIVGNGTFRFTLHNSTTAKKFGTNSTANAGIIAPRPETIVFGSGEISLDDLIRETKHGLFITNNWYTRFQNYRTGEYSTVPRDAAFLIEEGDLKTPVAGLRLSDSIPRQLQNIEFITSEREWIKWWEVETPTLAPAMSIRGVQVTRAVGS